MDNALNANCEWLNKVNFQSDLKYTFTELLSMAVYIGCSSTTATKIDFFSSRINYFFKNTK